MRVQVIRQGFYDMKRRYEGDIIDIDPKLFSKKWMKHLGEKEESSVKKAPVKKPKVSDEATSDEDVI